MGQCGEASLFLGRTRGRAVRVCAREATLFFATEPAVAVYPEGVTGWGAQIRR